MPAVECPNCRWRCYAPSGPGRARIHCPSCGTRFKFTRINFAKLAPAAGRPSPPPKHVDRRVRRKGHVIRLRCPHCTSLVDLCRRQGSRVRQPELVGAPAALAETELEAEALRDIVAESPPPPPAPPPRVRPAPPRAWTAPPPALPTPPPALPTPPVRPATLRVPPSPPARKPAAPTQAPAWVVAAAVIASSVALMCAVFPRFTTMVLPLAGLGLAAAGYALVKALRSDRSVNYPAVATAYGVLVLGVAAVFPGCLGPRYYES